MLIGQKYHRLNLSVGQQSLLQRVIILKTSALPRRLRRAWAGCGDEVQFATIIIIFMAAGKGDFEASLVISEKHFRHSRTKREFFFELKCMQWKTCFCVTAWNVILYIHGDIPLQLFHNSFRSVQLE